MFTFKTKGGHNAYPDRFVELTNCDGLRAVLGKNFSGKKQHRKRVDAVSEYLDYFIDTVPAHNAISGDAFREALGFESSRGAAAGASAETVGGKRMHHEPVKMGESFHALLTAWRGSGYFGKEGKEATIRRFHGGPKRESYPRGAMVGPSGTRITPFTFQGAQEADKRVAAYTAVQLRGGARETAKAGVKLTRIVANADEVTEADVDAWDTKWST